SELLNKFKKNIRKLASKTTDSTWYSEKKLLVTQISGALSKTDIEQWKNGFKDALEKVEANSSFKIFVNMYGFKATDLDAHKRFRGVIPLALADYGWKTGYVNLFEEEAKAMTFRNNRG